LAGSTGKDYTAVLQRPIFVPEQADASWHTGGWLEGRA